MYIVVYYIYVNSRHTCITYMYNKDAIINIYILVTIKDSKSL